MSSGTDYGQEYETVRQAYLLGKFEEASQMIDSMAQRYPKDPHVLLLRANIYCNGLREYELAQKQYESVLQLTDEPELLNRANSGIQQALQLQHQSKAVEQANVEEQQFNHNQKLTNNSGSQNWDDQSNSDWIDELELDGDRDSLEDLTKDLTTESKSQENPLNLSKSPETGDSSSDFPFLDMKIDEELIRGTDETPENEDATFVVFSETPRGMPLEGKENNFAPMDITEEDYDIYDEDDEEDETAQTEISSHINQTGSHKSDSDSPSTFQEFEGIDTGGSLEKDKEEAYDLNTGGFLDQFDLFDNNNIEENLSSLNEIEDDASKQTEADLFGGASESTAKAATNIASEIDKSPDNFEEEGIFNLKESSGNIESVGSSLVEESEGESFGPITKFQNSSLNNKQLYTTVAVGAVSLLAVAITGFASRINSSEPGSNNGPNALQIIVMGAVTGLVSGGATWGLTGITTNQVKRSVADLQNQFDSLYQGNFKARARVESRDELGQLSAKFNHMSEVIAKTTEEAQRRAQETEQAKEDLQRQVIRLLDDVEGAARGDLTVQAEVTADVLGAVADAFNLTITKLREIVFQVKQAAEQVNKGAADSELFANNQYSSALNMAGELAVTLNSVQMLTDSIQRVAENAKEAEQVARTSSETALKGGESVERTVAGVIEIRDKVAETARKVKRLAEASQEISKIVALISQISSRTNLLALNASIEAARAGESGRGFAIVADEVRQLADRSAKALKEIEQIVWQIQSETGSVMEAMEEALGQVVRVNQRAEQAKRSLDDIIQVSKHIDDLVRSITASTVEQRENSRAVSEVMQSVELAAQTTSRESQRVAGSLQKLVSISQELLGSVERFRIDKEEA